MCVSSIRPIILTKRAKAIGRHQRKEALTSLGSGSPYLIQQLDPTSYRWCRATVVYDPFVATEGLTKGDVGRVPSRGVPMPNKI